MGVRVSSNSLKTFATAPPYEMTSLKYLAHRANGTAWLERFRRAGKRYLANEADVQLFGFLVRDVSPHEDDVRVRVERLGQGCPDGTRIKLLALYLPVSRLEKIGSAAIAFKAGDTL